MTRPSADLAVIGAGVIGLSVAWRAATDGLSVLVCDPEPARGASWAAAGMLAPTTEARWGEEPLHRLAQDSFRRWPDFAARLEADTGVPVGLRGEGTLSVALDTDDYRQLAEAVDVQRSLGCEVELLSSRECRQLEPALSPRIVGGAFNPGDHQVDNRLLLQALMQAATKRGVRFEHQAVRRVEAAGVVLDDGTAVSVRSTVLSAGCRSGAVEGLSPEDAPPVRPVKGQILRLRSDPSHPVLTRTVRAVAQGRSVYLVPRASGELVVGATVEERGFDERVTAGAVYDLMRPAVASVPDVVELELAEATARLRPGSPDNGPLIGPAGADGLVIATGHFRHGILLAPVTMDAVAAYLCAAPPPESVAPFGATRFQVTDEVKP
jgi:glycine oxidase